MRLSPSATSVIIATLPAVAIGQTLHSFGNPSSHEQAYIERINRARANPGAEGALLAASTHPAVVAAFAWAGVDLAQFQAEMNAIPARSPLAPQEALMTAARGHSQWLFDNARQEHDQTGGLTFLQRLSAVGYSGSAAENVFSYADDEEHGHAGFEIDWASPLDPNATYGMQNPRGHRNNIHSGNYREIGVGVVNGTNSVDGRTVGPQLVTQDFGDRSAAPHYGTGVAYYDLNGNDSYDAGEGIPGLTVNVSGASYYCLTADGGGWTVPIPSSAATRTVTFSGPGLNQTVSLAVPSNSNAKTDLKLAYTPPGFTSPAVAESGSVHTLQFTPVPGAAEYNYTFNVLESPADENCENLDNATANGAYVQVQSAVKYEGTNAWRMAFAFPPANQSIELSTVFFGSGTSSLAFRSRLGWATSVNTAKVQVREEGTIDWVDVFTQNGTGGPGETSFQLRTVVLSSMAGKSFRIRFAFDINGSYYDSLSTGFGWYIDAIRFADVSRSGTKTTGVLTTTTATLPVPSASSWLFQIHPLMGGKSFPGASQVLQVLDTSTFSEWAAYHEAMGGLNAGSLTGDSDPDNDGRSSALEFVFGSKPLVADASPAGYPSLQPSSTHLILRYQIDTTRSGVTITPQAGTLSGQWYFPGQCGAPAGFTDSVVSAAGSIQTREARIPRESAPRQFLRLRATEP